MIMNDRGEDTAADETKQLIVHHQSHPDYNQLLMEGLQIWS